MKDKKGEEEEGERERRRWKGKRVLHTVKC